ncbi:hypothetical protein LIER_43674 [Lithospermum erythrorhizon]|uniref:Uncharacterized protein n=1 Tax=Lithospermum erythrorhizon TaxID=34254 RepID=A0AAV3QMK2_LITER
MADGEPSLPPTLHEEGLKTTLPFEKKDKLSTLFSKVVQMDTNLELDPFSLRPTSLYQGKPSVVLRLADKHTLLGNIKNVLVGKFSHGRPSMVLIKEFFLSWLSSRNSF